MARTHSRKLSQIVKALDQSAGIVTLAAQKLKITPQALRRYLRQFPELQEARDEATERNLDLAESNVVRGLQQNDKTYTIFYLKTKGKERGWVERQESTGAGGGPVQTEVSFGFENLTQDERDKLRPILERLSVKSDPGASGA